MRFRDFDLLTESVSPQQKTNFIDMFNKFLPLAMRELDLDSLPKFEFQSIIKTSGQPSFGMYSTSCRCMHVALSNRHPVDILRTVAHELVHYRQDLNDELNDNSGETGSPQENQAHELAGIVMRNFNKAYPEFLKSKPLVAESKKP